MQNGKNPYGKLFIAGSVGLLAAFAVGAIGAYLLGITSAAARRAEPPGPQATIAALTGAMDRADADAVLSLIDMNAVFNHFYRHILEANLRKPVTDEELKTYAAKNAPFIPVMADAVRHGVVTKSDRDAATGGSLLFGLVHLAEGKIVRKDENHASVVFADGSALLFERRESGWLVVGFDGIDAKLDEYRKSTYDAMGKAKDKAAKAGTPDTTGKDAAATGTGN